MNLVNIKSINPETNTLLVTFPSQKLVPGTQALFSMDRIDGETYVLSPKSRYACCLTGLEFAQLCQRIFSFKTDALKILYNLYNDEESAYRYQVIRSVNNNEHDYYEQLLQSMTIRVVSPQHYYVCN